MKVVFSKSDAAEPYSFRFTDDAGKIIVKSENYKAKNSALNGIESIKNNAASENRYELKTAKNGKVYFNLKSTNGQIIGTSPMFDNAIDRQKAMTLLAGDAVTAVLDDQSTEVSAETKKAASTAGTKTAPRPKPRNSEQLEPSVPIAEKVPAAKVSEKPSAPKAAPKATPKPKAAPKPAAKAKSAKAATTKKAASPKKAPAAKAAKATVVKKTAAPKPSKEREEKPSETAETQSSKSLIEKEKPHGIAENLADYIGKAASFGVSMGIKPMTLFVDVVKGFYHKISK